MFRIRFHGRGGQGMKTAANMLGDAFFACGYEVQDAPRYGAERRGAPMLAQVRAARHVIVERGAITAPDLVVVADPGLLGIAAAGVMQGTAADTVLFVNSNERRDALSARLAYPGRLVTWPSGYAVPPGSHAAQTSASCAAAAARLLGVIDRDALSQALAAQAGSRDPAGVEATRDCGLAAFDALSDDAGCVSERSSPVDVAAAPDWIRLQADEAALAVPDIFEPATSMKANTGLWRSHRPVIDYDRCNRCSWVCSTLCPDSAIRVGDDRTPHIDYEHCKGCMVCVMACPPHAIRQVAEADVVAGAAS